MLAAHPAKKNLRSQPLNMHAAFPYHATNRVTAPQFHFVRFAPRPGPFTLVLAFRSGKESTSPGGV
jgi:hypothetical protein